MPLQVIYISGEGRSGSTLLDRVLGTLEGVSSFNEVYELWEHGHLHHGTCACGLEITGCPFWAAVSKDVVEKHGPPEELLKLQDAVDHSRFFAHLYTGLQSKTFRRQLAHYREIQKTLYQAMASHSGTDVIVDSSKLPSRALILNQIPELQVHVIHIVRDLRGVIYSWSKLKWDPSTGDYLRRYRPIRTIAAWVLRNVLSELLATRMPYLRVRYEDWARQPRRVLQDVVRQIEPTSGKTLAFEGENEIELGPIHSVRGNPDRFVAGLSTIRLDEDWEEKLGRGPRWMATLLALPLLLRYGYVRRRTRPKGSNSRV